jgi:UDP-sugar transporter A1/2/3
LVVKSARAAMAAILSNPKARAAMTGSSKAFKRKASLVTLTFQNSIFILIMYYSRVMPNPSDHRYFTSTAVFLSELIKLGVALALTTHETSQSLAPDTPVSVILEQVYNSVFGGDGWKLAVPAAFYTLQNLLQYVAISNLDPVHFQVLYQLKILTTAIFSVTLLRRPLGPVRWAALILLTLGVCIVSLPGKPTNHGPESLFPHDATEHFFPRALHDLAKASPELYQPQSNRLSKRFQHIAKRMTHVAKRSVTYEGITEDLAPPEPVMNYSVGVTSVLIAAAVSGLTGVYFEKLLKEGQSQASVWVRNIQLSLYSLIAALLGGVLWQDGEGIREHGFFEGYNWVVWTAVVLQAGGGLLASVVIRDADNIVKNFATSISIIISFLLSMMLFNFTVTPTVS